MISILFLFISLLSSDSLLQRARQELLILKKASGALNRLCLSLDTKIHILESAVTSAVFHHGIEDLPDEILTKIIQSRYDETREKSMQLQKSVRRLVEEHENLRGLALVNRRFYNIVRSIPSTWCDMDHNRNDTDTTVIIGNPRILGNPTNARFDVLLSDGRTIGDALKHASRWTSLSAFWWDTSDDWDVRLEVEAIPTLEDLSMDHCAEFIRRFRLPSLKRLFTFEDPSILAPIMSQLTCLSLGVALDTPLEASELISAIALGKELRQLVLRISISATQSMNFIEFVGVQETSRLSNLEGFVIHGMLSGNGLRTCDEAMFRTLASTSRAFVMPNLRSLEVVLGDVTTYEPEDLSWEDMFPSARSFHHLQSLTFAAISLTKLADPESTAKHLPNFLRYFPHVHSLVLSPAQLPTICPKNTVIELSKLREITLDKCSMDEGQLEALLVTIFEQEVVNVERVTAISEVGGGEIARRLYASVHPTIHMERLNRRLNGDFCVFFT